MEPENKMVKIKGINNRYQITKLTQDKKIKLKKNNYDESYQNQIESIQEIHNNHNFLEKNKKYKHYLREIGKKLNNYKNQDGFKYKNNVEHLISQEEIFEKLANSNLKCYYCNQDVYVLYNSFREMNQWTLDRIDNNLGHFKNNVVICCLQCNLERKTKNMESFYFTKNLFLIKKE
jgi:hypothetical protein